MHIGKLAIVGASAAPARPFVVASLEERRLQESPPQPSLHECRVRAAGGPSEWMEASKGRYRKTTLPGYVRSTHDLDAPTTSKETIPIADS